MSALTVEACSFAEQRWEDGGPWDIDGDVLICEVHLAPAEGPVYETGVGLCQPQRAYVEAHGHPRADDPTRCECGRSWERCAADVRALLAEATQISTCRHCSRAIRRDGEAWLDETRDPAFCPHAISYRHAPQMAAASDGTETEPR